MSPPIESAKNVSPARQKIATHPGSTRTSSHIRPHTGRRRHSHVAERSRIASVPIVSTTNIRINGPLSRMPPASAVQKIAGHDQGGCTGSSPRCQDKYTRASAPMAATTVSSSIASVFASRASAPSNTELHRMSPASMAPRRVTNASAVQGRNAEEPNATLPPLQTKRRGGFDCGRLQPVYADRFLVAHLVLEPDIDEIAGLDHLLGGLREPRLVAINRRDVEKSRQENQQRTERQERDRPDMAARDKIKNADQPATAIYQVLRLARLSKSGAGIGLDHQLRLRRNRYADNRLANFLLNSDDNCVRGARGVDQSRSIWQSPDRADRLDAGV